MPAVKRVKATNNASLAVRLNHESKRIIEKAARACGQTMSGFTVSTLLRSASDILEQHQNIHLSDQDRDRFLAAIDSSPQPNQALRRAAERYKRQYS